MGIDDFVSLIVNNGVGVACIVYFMFRDYHFMQKLTDILSELNTTLATVRELSARCMVSEVRRSDVE